MKYLVQAFLFPFMATCYAQDSISFASIYFPRPLDKSWEASIGLTLTTTSKEITEEERRRLPCGDFHFLKKISHPLYLDGRVEFDIVQNHIAIGPRYIFKLSEKISASVGDDIAFWFGYLKTNEINYKAYGLINYPNLTIGFCIREDIALTLKGELQYNLLQQLYVGEIGIDKREKAYNGFALSAFIEQPFFKQKYLTLGFRALHSDFFWATWFLFETFERKIFHPQIIAGIIL
jgi:hypothetical protein